MRRRFLFRGLVATLSLSLFAAACGGDSGSGDDGLQTVASGKLTVCTDAPYAPFEYEGDDGELTGYDIEILREVGARVDLELEAKIVPFDGILGLLEAEECDVVGSAVTITDERAEQVDFSESYYSADQSLLAKTDSGMSGIADVDGEQLGVQSGTTGEAYAEEHAAGATIVAFEGAAELFAALESGQIIAILQDAPVNSLRAQLDDTLRLVEIFETGENYGFAVKTGNSAMLDTVNEGLAELRANGRFDEIFEQFFG